MPACKRCKTTASSEGWPRYERNGRLKVVCAECDAYLNAQRQEDADARARGYLDRMHTPEYRRQQRERVAAAKGRTLPEYTPQAERERQAGMMRVEKRADRLRAKWARTWLQSLKDAVGTLPEERAYDAAKTRRRYQQHRREEIARVADYKRLNADRNLQWTETRIDREREQADGTATRESIERLKHAAQNCAYCGCLLDEKQTDHMEPIARGGAHSLRNIVIVCPDCNGRKARLSYAEWIERVEPQHRARVWVLYEQRYGRAMEAA